MKAAAPAEVAAAILRARFPNVAAGPGPHDPASRAFPLADFQHDAVQRARAILRRRGGVVIADSVGLGKTYIAVALAEDALRAGESVLLTVPAALRRTWRPVIRRLRATTADGAAGDVAGATAGAVAGIIHLLSHTALARLHEPARFRDVRLVIADEAHAFRNRRTHRYRALAGITAHARVVLLTATPVNNGLQDLYALIRLFAHDAAFADLGVHDLRAAFREAERAPPPDIGPVLPVLREVMVRRTRPFIREHYGAVRLPGEDGATLRFPRRAPPRPVRYAVAANGAFEAMGRELMALDFAAMAVGNTSTGVAELARLGLLKRLESGLHAFRASIRRQLHFHDAFLHALAAGRLLRPRTLRAAPDDDQLLILPLVGQPVPGGVDPDALAARVRRDRDRLRRLETLAAASLTAGDPKLAALLQVMDELDGRKVVVFTEFRDTAEHLWHALLSRGHVGRVDGSGAWLGAGRAGRRVVIEHFAPAANAADPPPPHARVDTLIATDVLAEGLNLQDAAHVISYDLPWNPLRLIQRVGRVDRLGSPHHTVHPVFFLPGDELERLLGLVRRVRRKLATIGAAVGAEGAVLDGEDGGSVAEALARGDGQVLDALERADAAPFEAEERLRAVWERWAAEAGTDESAARRPPGAAAGARRVRPIPEGGPISEPLAATLADPAVDRPVTLVAARTSRGAAWTLVDDDGRCRDDPVAACRILEAALATDHRTMRRRSSRADGPGGTAMGGYGEATDGPHAAAGRNALVHLSARDAGPPTPAPVQARATRRLLRALAAEGDALAPATLRRADVVMERLATPLSVAGETRLESAMRDLEDGDRAARAIPLVRALERALAGMAGTQAAMESRRSDLPDPPRLIGVLRVVRAGVSGPHPPR